MFSVIIRDWAVIGQCWANAGRSWTEGLRDTVCQQTGHIDTILVHRWPIVHTVGPTLGQH